MQAQLPECLAASRLSLFPNIDRVPTKPTVGSARAALPIFSSLPVLLFLSCSLTPIVEHCVFFCATNPFASFSCDCEKNLHKQLRQNLHCQSWRNSRFTIWTYVPPQVSVSRVSMWKAMYSDWEQATAHCSAFSAPLIPNESGSNTNVTHRTRRVCASVGSLKNSTSTMSSSTTTAKRTSWPPIP